MLCDLMEFHIDPESPVNRSEFNQNKTYVSYCATGGRSTLAAFATLDMSLKPVVNLASENGA